jgi:ferredoxin
MTQTYTVEILHEGNTQTLLVAENQTILAAAQAAGIDLPFSCSAGVCTTCAAKILSGTVDQSGGMGVSSELQAEGYALLCVSYPRSDIRLESSKEEEVYHRQFIQPNA